MQHKFRMDNDPPTRSVLQQHIDYFDHDGAASCALGWGMNT